MKISQKRSSFILDEINLRKITKESLIDVLKLEVGEDQKHLVAPNSVSIAQAHFSEEAWFRAISLGDKPIGFVMLYDDPDRGKEENHHYDLWRFMIDRNYQGKGYGKRALELVIEFIRKESTQKDMSLSVVPADGGAEPFYRQFGFEFTGEIDDGEKVYNLKFH